MSDKKDLLKEYLHTGVDFYPEVDLEATIMAAVRKVAAEQRKARRLRRRGMFFLTGFILLLALALWLTNTGYAHSPYQSQLTNYCITLLFTLVFFAQLEAWWKRRLPLPLGEEGKKHE